MSTHSFTTVLPAHIASALSKRSSVKDSEKSDVEIIHLATKESVKEYLRYLQSNPQKVDNLVYPTFGSPAQPFVPVDTQVEIHKIISLLAENNKQLSGGSYRFVTNSSLQEVIKELMNVDNILCELCIVYVGYLLILTIDSNSNRIL